MARNGQVKWHGNIKNVMEVWETAIKYHDTYARCKLQMQYAKEHKFKAFKLTFLAFLHICAIQNIVTLSFDENYNMGFVGITKITVNPATGNRFFNRYLLISIVKKPLRHSKQTLCTQGRHMAHPKVHRK